MPLGVLSFLLESDELIELENTTDKKFWNGVQGWHNYRVEFTKLHGYDRDVLEEVAEVTGVPLTFPKFTKED